MTKMDNILYDSPLLNKTTGGQKLKILIVSWHFPPYNTVGAIRAGRLATYLLNAGHDVKVLCADGIDASQDLRSDFPPERIHRARSYDISAPLKKMAALRHQARAVLSGVGRRKYESCTSPVPATKSRTANPERADLMRTFSEWYLRVVGYPDSRIGWFPPAVSVGNRILSDWQPDFMYATAPPFTTHLVARRLSSKFKVPWMAEYRDRFFEDPYGPPQPIKKKVDKFYEDRIIATASAIVTVSDIWSDDYRVRYPLPVETVYNGFDPIDFPVEVPREPSDPDQLRLVYTGILYHERRDPSPLFEAISLLGDRGKSVRVAFYGTDETVLRQCANRYGVMDQIDIHPRIPYKDSISRQMQADVLLLLQWNDPREIGNVPSKLFEYLASRRPVLGIGIETGIPARILRERDAGVVMNDPQAIAERLSGWLEQKRELGAIPLLPKTVRDGLSRDGQYQKLETFLLETANLPANK